MTVHSLAGYTLAVPEVEAGRRFFEDFGLQGREERDQIALRCKGSDTDQVTLRPGKGRRLHHITFNIGVDAGPGFRRKLESQGVRIMDPPDNTGAFAVRDPDDNLVMFRPHAKPDFLGQRKKNIDAAVANFNRTPGGRGCPDRFRAQPWRLGHMLLFTPNVDRMIDFYTKHVGMLVSDRSGSIIAFMRTSGGSDHHVLALAMSDRPGYHHGSFEVSSVDEIGIGAAHMLGKGYKDGWGFGRHVIGSNFFHYIRDPWGSLAEYFFDVDYVADDAKWDMRDWPGEDSLYLWGPGVPADFVQNFDAPAR
jgi:catechol 2,3-dioxygenase